MTKTPPIEQIHAKQQAWGQAPRPLHSRTSSLRPGPSKSPIPMQPLVAPPWARRALSRQGDRQSLSRLVMTSSPLRSCGLTSVGDKSDRALESAVGDICRRLIGRSDPRESAREVPAAVATAFAATRSSGRVAQRGDFVAKPGVRTSRAAAGKRSSGRGGRSVEISASALHEPRPEPVVSDVWTPPRWVACSIRP
jgi:hypothetical protein